MIDSHFWIEKPLKLHNHIIQIKASVCDSECPYDIELGRPSQAQLSAWQDYASKQLYIQQIYMSHTKCEMHVVAATCSTSVSLLP